MSEVGVVKAEWRGGPGGLGVSTFVLSPQAVLDLGDVQAGVDAVAAFFNGIKQLIPTGYTIQVLGDVNVYEHTTATLTGALAATPPAAIVCTGGVAYAAPVGAAVQWDTATIQNGHRLRGRTFLVPLINTAFDTSGSLGGSIVTTIETVALAMADTTVVDLSRMFYVWGRPKPATETAPAKQATLGPITGVTIRDKAMVLRGRRD